MKNSYRQLDSRERPVPLSRKLKIRNWKHKYLQNEHLLNDYIGYYIRRCETTTNKNETEFGPTTREIMKPQLYCLYMRYRKKKPKKLLQVTARSVNVSKLTMINY